VLLAPREELLRLGGGSADVRATHAGSTYQTEIDTGKGVGADDVVIGHTLPAGVHPATVTLDGRRLHHYRVVETNRGTIRAGYAVVAANPRTAIGVWAIAADTDEEAERLASSIAMSFAMLRRGTPIPVPPRPRPGATPGDPDRSRDRWLPPRPDAHSAARGARPRGRSPSAGGGGER
jgi:hypothetical protein